INREQIEKEIENVESEISLAYEQMKQCLISIENKRKQKNELETEISEYSSQIAVFQNDIDHNNENISRVNNELENEKYTNENIEEEILEKQEKIKEIIENNKKLNEEIEKNQTELFSKKEKNQIEDENRKNLTEKLNNLLLEQSENKMIILQNQSNYDEITASIERNSIEFNAISQELSKFEIEEKNANEAITILNEKSESFQNILGGHKLKLNNRSLKLKEIKAESDKLSLLIKEKQQRVKMLDNLEKSNEGFYGSVKEVLKHSKSGQLDGIYGTLSQIVNVKNEFSLAIETALGGSLQNIIVENEKAAKNAMNFLKQGKLGRATFLPLTTIKGNLTSTNGMSEFSGFINLASNLVEFDEKFRQIIQSFLGRVVVVDDIDTAVLIAKKYDHKFKIVTLDGQVVNAGGSFTGGSKNKSFGFLSRKNEILNLDNEIIELG
ncbi:MAG: chromosome segregation protein SMC, partial [Oscillospiraceae bacterium]